MGETLNKVVSFVPGTTEFIYGRVDEGKALPAGLDSAAVGQHFARRVVASAKSVKKWSIFYLSPSIIKCKNYNYTRKTNRNCEKVRKTTSNEKLFLSVIKHNVLSKSI